MATGTLISLDEYLSTIYEPDRDFVDGHLIERNVGESEHSGLQMIISALLYSHRREAGIYVFPELRVQVARNRYRIPDITVTTRKVAGRILREPPFLCIEVLSPEDRESRLAVKIADYLAFGVPHIWVIDPQHRQAWSYTSEGKRDSADVLTTTNPDLTVRLSDLFTALDDAVEPGTC